MYGKNYKFISFILCSVVIIFCSVIFFACTGKKIIEGVNVESENGSGRATSLNNGKFADMLKKESAYRLFKADAEGAVEAGEYQKAIGIFSHALDNADSQEKQVILREIDQALVNVDPDFIREIINSPDNSIPVPMLMYRLGLNLILQKKYFEAKEVLSRLLEKYPDYEKADNIKDILEMLKKHEFRKNTIGCMLPLSGRFGVFGQRALMGIEMAINDLSKEFGTNIVIIVKDTKSDNSVAVQCVKELGEKNVAAIAGPIITSELAGKEADQLGIPIIVMTQKSQIAKEGNYIFSNFITPEMQVRALISFAERNFNVQKFAVLYPDDRYGRTYMDIFLDEVMQTGSDIADAEPYTDSQTDFSDVIKKLIESSVGSNDSNGQQSVTGDNFSDVRDNNEFENKNISENKQGRNQAESDKPVINFQAVFIPDKASRISLILPQLAYNDVTGVYLLGTNIWHDKTLLKYASEYATNSVITEGYFAESKNQKAHGFAEEFRRLYGEEPGFIEAVAYDTAVMLIRTAMDPAINSRQELRDALAGKRVFDGVTGRTIFGEDGNARKELFYLTIKKGKFVEIDSNQ